MSAAPSLVKRVGVAKLIGLGVGLAGFFVIPRVTPELDLWFRLGFLFWYANFGAMIGMLGTVNFHPLLKFPMPFWFRGILFGAWFNLLATLLAHEQIATFLKALDMGIESPFWFVAEGSLVGLVIDAVVTRVGGEGKGLLD